ncbi:MAG: UDP-N-acetyl-D-glucosamine 2-epimerase, UDP-hydrolysing [Candidatus Omnitrophica bacterium CG1_02_49_16]|nr:MAG: UDP-N-acetyl-D-glucosamine 2-epimerase, UDP-hydrolysing [Candidatus Omnitrophica bacterium CG1_02_49_16]
MKIRKICIVTGSRADYGLLYWLMKEIRLDPQLKLQIVATGAHLSSVYGDTLKNIKSDGFNVDAKISILTHDNSPRGVTKSLAAAVSGFADVFERLLPHIVVVLGDRYEIFAAAQAAMIAGIPIAHIHGGESTEGMIDEAIRHSITKMAHFHFVAAQPYRKRLIQLGENPSRIFNYGAPGLDNLSRLPLLSRSEVEEALGLRFKKRVLLVTYHPVTLGHDRQLKVIRALLEAIDGVKDATILMTKANADSGGSAINQLINAYAKQRKGRVYTFASMGQLNYLSSMKHADLVLGNSSSGLIEAPSFKKPSVNIGPRQRGRLRASSVIDCGESRQKIASAIQKAFSPSFQQSLEQTESPYGRAGHISVKIKEKLKHVKLEGVLMKRFYEVFFNP